MDYRGDPSTARARLVMGAYPEAQFATLFVSHFSGSVAVDLGSDANGLYDKWATTRGDDTPSGRQAAAEVRYAAANMAEQTGKISPDTAAGIRDRATAEWIAAERDRLATDPEMLVTADGGRPEDIDVLSAEVGRIIEFEAKRTAAGDESSLGSMAPVVEVLSRYEAAITTKVLNSADLMNKADSGLVSNIGEVMDVIGLVLGLDRQIQLLGGVETASLAKVVDLLSHVSSALLRSCKEAPVDPVLILGLERFVQLLGAGNAVSFAEIAECAALTNRPTPKAGLHRITGQITLDETEPRTGSRSHAVFDLVIIEDEGGSLVFAPGSTGKVDWTLAPAVVWEGCPSTASSKITIGTMNNEVIHALSEPNPDTTALPIWRGGDLEIFGLGFPATQRGTGLGGVACMFAGPGLTCGYAPAVGRLVHDNPYEWSFSCSSDQDGGSGPRAGG